MMNRCDLLHYLLEKGLLDCAQAKVVEVEQKRTGKTTETLVKELGFLSQDLVISSIVRKNNLEYLDLSQASVNMELARKVSKEYCVKNKVLAFDENEHVVLVAIVEEIDMHVRDYISRVFDKDLTFFVVDENALLETVEYIFSAERSVKSWVELLDQQYSDDESFATRLVYELISHCIRKGVSDIHIEPEEFFVRIRIRKDGVLQPLCVFPKEKWAGLCVRIKILSNMDISQSFLPQDGRFDFYAFGKKVDLRVSSRPVVFGENIVIRVLDTNNSVLSLEELGYSQENLNELSKILRQTNGVFIVTGPTGSGKSTLLFSMLMRLSKSSVSIATIEDPVEYTFPYFRQTDMNTNKNMKFADAMRSILRQDPDIISISEVRDPDTATMAMRAAMTGRMVLTTLHTNDIFGIFDRLNDLGVEKRLLVHHLSGIATQRLVRSVCCHCCEKVPPNEYEKALLANIDVDEISKARGCEHCNYSGYGARFAVCQVLSVDDEIRDLLEQNDIFQAKTELYKRGLKSLKDELRLRIASGQTTIDEVNRVFYLG